MDMMGNTYEFTLSTTLDEHWGELVVMRSTSCDFDAGMDRQYNPTWFRNRVTAYFGNPMNSGGTVDPAGFRPVPDEWHRRLWTGSGSKPAVPQLPRAKGVLIKDVGNRISPYNQEEVEEFWTRAATIAERILSGKTGIIEGARILVSMTSLLRGIEHDTDFITFSAIDCETDHLPIGEERKLWAESALRKKDEEIKQMEDDYREKAFAACRSLIERWKDKR